MTKERELLVYSAKLAEQAERYEGMILFISTINCLILDLFASLLDRFSEF